MTSFVVHDVQQPPQRVTRHVNAGSIEHVLSLLTTHRSKARIIAGGTDLMLELERRSRPGIEILIDISRIEGMDAIYEAKDRVNIGPLVTHNQAATNASVRQSGLPLAQACLEIGSPALRNRATIVGNVVTASPANDTISALRALNAEVSIASERGMRSVTLQDFHTGVRSTILADDEMVTGISFPSIATNERGIFVKLGLRRAQAISVVHMATILAFETDEQPAGSSEVTSAPIRSAPIKSARIAVGSVAPTIVRLSAVEDLLVGNTINESTIREAVKLAEDTVAPIDDLRATATYRSDQVGLMLGRSLEALANGQERSAFPMSIPVLGGPSVLADRVSGELVEGDVLSATVNGTVVSGAWQSGSMLDWLREQPNLTGTKEGCAEGECGACTVSLSGTSALSCLVPAGRADGAIVGTIEGLQDDVQEAFIDESAAQCGYCIPGFVMAAASLRADCAAGPGASAPTKEEMKLGLSGNLCRCTGYYSIERAVGRSTGSNA